jgi:serine/threonine-protein kinase RsbW
MTQSDKMKAIFPAKVEELGAICNLIHEAARACGMVDENIWKLETAVDEACTNIACYGYRGITDGQIWLEWECKDDRFIVTIQDTGVPFDQTQPTDPDFSSELCKRQVGGLGRFIMRQFVDGMKYSRNGEKNSLTLIKRLKANTESA